MTSRGLWGLNHSGKAMSLSCLSVDGSRQRAKPKIRKLSGEIEMIWLELEAKLPAKLFGKPGIEQD